MRQKKEFRSLHIRVFPNIYNKLLDIAEEKGMSKTQICRGALAEYILKHERHKSFNHYLDYLLGTTGGGENEIK